MISFTTIIKKFAKQGEKTGWTYVDISADIAQKLKPGNKKSFRVKGKLDDYSFEKVALMPMGKGEFMMPLNATHRKGIGKKHGAMVKVKMIEDTQEIKMNADLMECLNDEKEALEFFNFLSKSNQKYFSNWVDTAKTIETKSKRIALIISALYLKQNFGEMIRSQKKEKFTLYSK